MDVRDGTRHACQLDACIVSSRVHAGKEQGEEDNDKGRLVIGHSIDLDHGSPRSPPAFPVRISMSASIHTIYAQPRSLGVIIILKKIKHPRQGSMMKSRLIMLASL